ncbi:DUF934 domain-containing protein [Thalassobaculum litoreum]|uniref:Uncharacterized conserved protein, DUF934 family n=1 Tax=Thalassobaculum litoreum DSM 18839 TaxID=1123362 RepID=A0A8G2F2F6_9PROT|nr:DUF934 domain-containing protein [Thalassobaculum litoreum]SDF51849.1 Uncharacterized conserved protein, DUF934 family [Thalassobaculum litoreum DSM 18839]
MPIVKHDCVIEDVWRPLNGRDLTEICPNESVLLSLEEWRSIGRAAAARFERIGIALAPDEAVEDIVDALPELDLVALSFPKFNDGRAFSQARLLRERLGFIGEIRATGHVIRDLFLFMQRSGFDAVAVEDTRALTPWLAARRRFTGFYQPALDHEDEPDEAPAPATAGSGSGTVGQVACGTDSVAALWAY